MIQMSENRSQISDYGSEFKNKVANTKGITLIALIITIIVMLILVAVTVSVVVNSGLFKHANDAGEGWKQAQEKEQNIGAGNVQVGEYGSIDEYISNNPVMKLKVGDYIDYKPDVATDYTLTAAVSGADTDQTIAQENLKWRVLSVNADGTVDIVSEMPTTTEVTFKGALGVNNGVLVLNDICQKQYSNTTLGTTGRSLDLVDIEKKFNSSAISVKNAFNNGLKTYGDTKEYTGINANIPDILSQVTGTTTEDESNDGYSSPTTANSTSKSSLTVTQTHYNLESSGTPDSYFDDKTFHKLVFSTGKAYWLASRYMNCNLSCADFGLRNVGINGSFNNYGLFSSSGNPGSARFAVRPVVALGSNVKISTTGGTADNPRTISL